MTSLSYWPLQCLYHKASLCFSAVQADRTLQCVCISDLCVDIFKIVKPCFWVFCCAALTDVLLWSVIHDVVRTVFKRQKQTFIWFQIVQRWKLEDYFNRACFDVMFLKERFSCCVCVCELCLLRLHPFTVLFLFPCLMKDDVDVSLSGSGLRRECLKFLIWCFFLFGLEVNITGWGWWSSIVFFLSTSNEKKWLPYLVCGTHRLTHRFLLKT